MAYTPTQWKDEQPPAINATNLNKIEQGIKAAHDGVDAAAAHAARRDNPHQVTRQQVGANQVAILTGTVAHGGTIPLPSGYTQEQCWWMVSIRSQSITSAYGDATEVRCFASSTTREVSVYAQVPREGSTPVQVPGNADYIIIGVR